jgi:phenylacetaldehyde dehydrogenase
MTDPSASEGLFCSSPEVEARLAAPWRMVIDGEFVDADDAATIDVYDPADGQVITKVPAAGPADIDRAVSAATEAFRNPAWRNLRAVDRERFVRRFADVIEAHSGLLSEIECRDSGKSASLAKRVDLPGAVDFLRYIAGWATKLNGTTTDVSFPRPRGGGDFFAYTRQEPVGVVGAIIPWNFPLLMAVWKLGPPLVTGCTVVLKPAEETPLTALILGELALAAGIPPGVVNVVTGTGPSAGAALAKHPGIAKLAFTGSTDVGKSIGKVAMDRMARVSLELGGKSPIIVLDDANIEAVVAGASSAIFYNNGQVCFAGSRLYIQRKLFDEVVERIAARANAMRMGPGIDPKAQIGPLVSARHRDRVLSYIDIGLNEGAEMVTGGSVDRPGYYVKPTPFSFRVPLVRGSRRRRYSDRWSWRCLLTRSTRPWLLRTTADSASRQAYGPMI